MTQQAIGDNLTNGYFNFLGISVIYGLAAAALTAYYGPGANGSGLPELMGYLNGVRVPKYINIPSLVTKVVGTGLSNAGGLFIGKEGPLAHIGATVGALSAYLPFNFTKSL